MEKDTEQNNIVSRAGRYARVGSGVGTAAARIAAGRLFGADKDAEGRLLKEALGSLKGPLMKVAQLLATIPDAIPPEYAKELAQLQSYAPPMGWPFVRRRMAAELGADWQQKFAGFEHEAAHAASLGQVHRASLSGGHKVACKLQYPNMESAVEADLNQLNMVFRLHRQMDRAIDTSEIAEEIGARLREELDYVREAKQMAMYRKMLKRHGEIVVPEVFEELSTSRLITMSWLEGKPLMDFKGADQATRNEIASYMFKAWWAPFCSHGVIHGDPHLGNYAVRTDAQGHPVGLNLLDFGCIRIFPQRFAEAVLELYHGLMEDDRDRIVAAYETWGFKGLKNDLIDILNIWARFIYGPLMHDKVMKVSDGSSSAAEYGRQQAFTVHKHLKEKGPVKVPREFVFMDRAAIGLGSVFIHLQAELNFYQLFHEALNAHGDGLSGAGARQAELLAEVGL